MAAEYEWHNFARFSVTGLCKRGFDCGSDGASFWFRICFAASFEANLCSFPSTRPSNGYDLLVPVVTRRSTDIQLARKASTPPMQAKTDKGTIDAALRKMEGPVLGLFPRLVPHVEEPVS